MGVRTLKRAFANGLVYVLVVSLLTTPVYPAMAFAVTSPDTSGSPSQSHLSSIPTPPNIPAAQSSPVFFEGDPVYVAASGGQLGRTFNVSDSSPTWENITPPTGGAIHHFVLDPRDAYGTAWLANDEGVWRNTNLTDSSPQAVRDGWTKVYSIETLSAKYNHEGCTVQRIAKIIPDPQHPNRVMAFATVQAAAQYDCRTAQITSTDNGDTWILKELPQCFEEVYRSTISPQQRSCYFPGTVDIASDGTMYLLQYITGFAEGSGGSTPLRFFAYRSSNAGQTWSLASRSEWGNWNSVKSLVSSLIVSETNPQKLLATFFINNTESGLLDSSDGGANWTYRSTANKTLPFNMRGNAGGRYYTLSHFVESSGAEHFFAKSSERPERLYKSVDASTWQLVLTLPETIDDSGVDYVINARNSDQVLTAWRNCAGDPCSHGVHPVIQLHHGDSGSRWLDRSGNWYHVTDTDSRSPTFSHWAGGEVIITSPFLVQQDRPANPGMVAGDDWDHSTMLALPGYRSHAFVGAPVDTVTGHYVHSATDFTVQAQGQPLSFHRTYSSRRLEWESIFYPPIDPPSHTMTAGITFDGMGDLDYGLYAAGTNNQAVGAGGYSGLGLVSDTSTNPHESGCGTPAGDAWVGVVFDWNPTYSISKLDMQVKGTSTAPGVMRGQWQAYMGGVWQDIGAYFTVGLNNGWYFATQDATVSGATQLRVRFGACWGQSLTAYMDEIEITYTTESSIGAFLAPPAHTTGEQSSTDCTYPRVWDFTAGDLEGWTVMTGNITANGVESEWISQYTRVIDMRLMCDEPIGHPRRFLFGFWSSHGWALRPYSLFLLDQNGNQISGQMGQGSGASGWGWWEYGGDMSSVYGFRIYEQWGSSEQFHVRYWEVNYNPPVATPTPVFTPTPDPTPDPIPVPELEPWRRQTPILGQGWTHNFNLRLFFDPNQLNNPDHRVILQLANGSSVEFTYDSPTQKYMPEGGLLASLEREAETNLPWTVELLPDHTVYRFDNYGRLREISQKQGFGDSATPWNPIDLEYTSEDGQGEIRTIHSGDIYLHFSYDEGVGDAKRLKTLCVSNSNEADNCTEATAHSDNLPYVRFDYNCPSDHAKCMLETAADPLSRAWNYEYRPDVPLLEKVKDPLGILVESQEFETEGQGECLTAKPWLCRVTKQTVAESYLQLDYTTVPGKTVVVDNYGNVTAYSYEKMELWYGGLDWTQVTDFGEQENYQISEIRVIDGDDNVSSYTSYGWDSMGLRLEQYDTYGEDEGEVFTYNFVVTPLNWTEG